MTNPSDPTPERPGMDQEAEAHPGTPRETEAEETDGQVSEVGRLDASDAGTPIQPSDSTAGYTESESESGDPDTQAAGPDAVPPENRRDNDFRPRDGQLGDRVDDA
ncbi:hypothetical protein [Nocardioides sp. AN3]